VTLEPGTLIAGRYAIERVLGEGATGVVYRATQRPLGREVALKILRSGLAGDPRALARFEREAKVASALEHPLAVAIYDFGQDSGSAFLAMELLHGASLRSVMHERLPLGRALAIAYDVADILATAHRIPLVHRDLKPENVFVEPEGDRARIVDFGLAFIAERTDSAGRMTVEGVVAGTPSYLSPEQARGLDIGPPTDVYALGCMLFELVTGRVPFTGTEVEVLTKQLFAPPPPLRSVRDDVLVPAALEELIFAMLKKRAEERPTAARARDMLALVDPDVAKARGRARDDSFLLGREARMVEPVASRVDRHATDGPLLAITRPVSPELLVALAANAIVPYVVTADEDLGGAAVVYVPDGDVDEVASLSSAHAVITDTDAEDIERISALVRAGASEVVVKPVRPEELARRVIRAAKKRERRGAS
jgi:serine/threonine protein kinase